MADKQPTDKNKDQIVGVIKEYISPILITVIGMFVWRDMSELRDDVKTLLANQSANQVKIENLQADVTVLKAYVYSTNYEPFTGGVKLPPSQPAKKEDEIKIKRR